MLIVHLTRKQISNLLRSSERPQQLNPNKTFDRARAKIDPAWSSNTGAIHQLHSKTLITSSIKCKIHQRATYLRGRSSKVLFDTQITVKLGHNRAIIPAAMVSSNLDNLSPVRFYKLIILHQIVENKLNQMAICYT